MLACLVAGAILQVFSAHATAPLARHRGGRANETTAAVLTARGGYQLDANSKKRAAEPGTPECSEPCDDYTQGVDQETESVCIDAYRTCAHDGCGMGLCMQRFNDDCTDYCSEWADVTVKSLNVCQHKTDSYKCSGEKECPEDTYRCKQKKVEDCWIFCEEYEFSGGFGVDHNSDLVCQNLGADNDDFGVCLPLPCDRNHHNSNLYTGAKICRQTHPQCRNSCAAGSDEPNSTTVCFDEWSEKCENHEVCPHQMTRCQPTKVHQDLSNVDNGVGNGWTLSEKSEGKAFVGGQSVEDRQREARRAADQQRAKAAAQRRAQRKKSSIMRRDLVIDGA